MQDPDRFLAECRECNRAFAIKLDLLGYEHTFIAELLNVSTSFIRKWRGRYRRDGIESLYLQYHGSQGYLSPIERAEMVAFLKTKDSYTLEELCAYVDEHYL